MAYSTWQMGVSFVEDGQGRVGWMAQFTPDQNSVPITLTHETNDVPGPIQLKVTELIEAIKKWQAVKDDKND